MSLLLAMLLTRIASTMTSFMRKKILVVAVTSHLLGWARDTKFSVFVFAPIASSHPRIPNPNLSGARLKLGRKTVISNCLRTRTTMRDGNLQKSTTIGEVFNLN